MPVTIYRTISVTLALALVAGAAGADIDDYCSAPEQVGDAAPSDSCSGYMAIVGEVAAAAAPCWEAISERLPLEEWKVAREQCEVQAHLAVCGQVPCY